MGETSHHAECIAAQRSTADDIYPTNTDQGLCTHYNYEQLIRWNSRSGLTVIYNSVSLAFSIRKVGATAVTLYVFEMALWDVLRL
jgi:hypothetical protein